jgi:hypothetical protein
MSQDLQEIAGRLNLPPDATIQDCYAKVAISLEYPESVRKQALRALREYKHENQLMKRLAIEAQLHEQLIQLNPPAPKAKIK